MLLEEKHAVQMAGLQMVADIMDGTTKIDIDALCKQLLTPAEIDDIQRIPYRTSLGATAKTVDDMSYQLKQRMLRLGGPLLLGLARKLKAGTPDVGGVLDHLLQRSAVLNDELMTAQYVGTSPLDHPICRQLSESIATATRLGDRRLASQLLSIVVAAMSTMKVTTYEVEQSLTQLVELQVDEPVKIIVGKSRKYVHGVVVHPVDENNNVTVRSNANHDGEDVLDDEHASGGTLHVVTRDKIIAVMDVRVNKHKITASSTHAKNSFAGAPIRLGAPRHVQRVSHAVLMDFVDFVASPACIRILDSSSHHKTRGERVDIRSELLKEYRRQATENGISSEDQVCESFFYAHWPDDIVDASKEAECVCGKCYHCGTQSFVGILSLLQRIEADFTTVLGMHEVVTDLRSKVTVVRELFEREFYRHSAMQSRTIPHCRVHALSATYGQQQSSVCQADQHANVDGQVPTTALRMHEEWLRIHRPDLSEDTLTDGWHEMCGCYTDAGVLDVRYAGCGKGGQAESRQPMMCD